jgi:methyl-accepting chemotaxis protein
MFSNLLTSSVGQVVHVSKTAMEMVYSLDVAMTNLKSIEGFITRVQKINNKARVLALNATIEATKAGEVGGAFMVVAQEVKDMSGEIDGLSHEMKEKISAVSESVKDGFGKLQDVATIDMSENIKAKEKLEKLVTCMLSQGEQFRGIIEDSVTSSRQMASTIGKMVVDMQFQDRNSQYIDNSVKALSYMAEDLIDHRIQNGETREELIDHLNSAFTLSEFKQQFREYLFKHNIITEEQYIKTSEAMETKVANSSNDDDIELF